MKLTVVGCSPAWPNARGAHSGYLFEAEGARVLVDCGPGVLARMRTGAAWPAVDAIVISHLHLDHCGDLVPWLWGLLIGPGAGSPAPELWLPPGGLGRLTAFAPEEQFAAGFALHEYGESLDVGPFRLTTARVQHYDEPTWGMRVEHGGRAVAYSADSALTPSLVDLAADADVFLCEATLLEPERERHGHMTAGEAREAAAAASAKRLLITHRDAAAPVDELVYDGFVVEP